VCTKVHKIVVIHFKLKLKRRWWICTSIFTFREFVLVSFSVSVMMLSRNLYCCLLALVFYLYFWRTEDIEKHGHLKVFFISPPKCSILILISFKLGVASFILHNSFDNFTKTIQRMRWQSSSTSEVAENKRSNSNSSMSRSLGWRWRKWPRSELFLDLEFMGEVWSVFMWPSLIPSTPPSLSKCVPVFISKNVVILTVKLSLHSERVENLS
jgi:hypothetical protein